MNEGCSLLTIDDEEPIRRGIRAYFEDAGLRVMEAESGRNGLSVFREKRPSLVLVDLRMPGIGGLEVIETLAREAPETPVVALSGTGFIGDAIEAIRKGAWDYVTKPIADLAELEHVAKRCLERAKLLEENRRYREQLEEIVARRTAELMESEKKFRDLVENISDVVYAVDKDGVVTYASPVVESFAGYRPEELIGRPFQDFVLPQARSEAEAKFLETLKGSSVQYEFMADKKCGDLIWVRSSSRPVWKGKDAVGVQGVLTDVTERKRAELELAARAGELATLNSLGRRMGAELRVDTTVRMAVEHVMKAVSPDLVVLFLKEGEELTLKGFLSEEKWCGEEDFSAHRVGRCLCGIAAEEGAAVYSADIHQDPRCSFEECKRYGLRSFSALPLSGPGEVLGVLGIASCSRRDLETQGAFLEAMAHEIAIGIRNALLYEKAQTDAVELHTRLEQIAAAEKEKEELTRQLYQAQKLEAIGTLAGGIAHDFNNILSPIIMGAELALMTVPLGNQAYPMIQKILAAGTRAKDLVQQILAFSRQSDLERKPLSLAPLIKETVKLARASLPSTIEIRQKIDAERDVVLANPTQVHQLMMNLIANAGHAMRATGGVLEVRLENKNVEDGAGAWGPEIQAGHFAKLIVSDTGHGIDAMTRERIFNPFFSTKVRGEGTGLGLSIVHGIIKSYGGAITVESRPGHGASFTILIPLVGDDPEEPTSESPPLPFGHERILFVDDEPFIMEISKQILNRLGYQVDTRTDPLEALERFRKDPGRYDLVITDMTMPGMTGDRLAVELLRIRPGLPILLCTGFSEQITEASALEMGIKGFILKPMAMAEIAQKIREVLEIEKAEAPPGTVQAEGMRP
jgi:PAS domain S-box-containing protein